MYNKCKKFWKEKKRIIYLGLAAFLTLLITSYFLFPMLEQMIADKFVFNELTTNWNLSSRTMPLWSLFLEFPNYILSNEWMPPGIGLSFVFLIYCYIKNFKSANSFMHFCFITGIIVLFCLTNLFPWNFLQSIMSPIQFPWRFLFISTLLISIGGGLLFNQLEHNINEKIKILFMLCVLPILLVSLLNFRSQNVKEVGNYYIAFGEYLPEYADEKYILDRGNIITSEKEAIYTFDRNGVNLDIYFSDNNSENKFELPLLYYKGYVANINGEKINTYKTTNGLVGIDIPNIENGNIYVRYEGTVVQKVSKLISLISIVLFISWFIVIKRKKVKNENN